MKLVRNATPGIVARIRSSSFRKASPCDPRFMRASTLRLACAAAYQCISPGGCGRQGFRASFGYAVRVSIEKTDPQHVFHLRQALEELREAIAQARSSP